MNGSERNGDSKGAKVDLTGRAMSLVEYAECFQEKNWLFIESLERAGESTQREVL